MPHHPVSDHAQGRHCESHSTRRNPAKRLQKHQNRHVPQREPICQKSASTCYRFQFGPNRAGWHSVSLRETLPQTQLQENLPKKCSLKPKTTKLLKLPQDTSKLSKNSKQNKTAQEAPKYPFHPLLLVSTEKLCTNRYQKHLKSR